MRLESDYLVVECTFKATERGFKDWVEAPKKELKVLEVLTDFERRFERLSTQDKMILMFDKVFMFLCAVDVRDQHGLGI